MESAPRQTSAYGWHNPRLTLQQARCTSLPAAPSCLALPQPRR